MIMKKVKLSQDDDGDEPEERKKQERGEQMGMVMS